MGMIHAFAALAVASAFGASAAAAVLPAKPAEPAGQNSTLEVDKVHGWHSYCARGPVRWHRHVPGIGNVPCAPRPVYRAPYAPRVIIVPRHRPRARWY
jgi:hypothetical protein